MDITKITTAFCTACMCSTMCHFSSNIGHNWPFLSHKYIFLASEGPKGGLWGGAKRFYSNNVFFYKKMTRQNMPTN